MWYILHAESLKAEEGRETVQTSTDLLFGKTTLNMGFSSFTRVREHFHKTDIGQCIGYFPFNMCVLPPR